MKFTWWINKYKLRVRIHVESAIERLNDFKIFQGNLALTLASHADQMLIVCGALCNFWKQQSFFRFTVYFAPCQNMPKMKCNVCYA